MNVEKLPIEKRLSTDLAQRTFEKYVTNYFETGYNLYGLYGYLENRFVFTNGIGFYGMNKHYEISKFIIESNQKWMHNNHRAREASSDELEEYLKRLNGLFWGDVVNIFDIDSTISNGDEILFDKTFFHNLEIQNLKIFLCPNRVCLSKKTPMLYAESEKGYAYIFGYKHR